MGNTVKMLVRSRAKEGMDAEYNAWYSGTHIPDMLLIDGVASCTRHRLRNADGEPAEYLAIYEIDGDIDLVQKEIAARIKDGRMQLSPAIDAANGGMTVWEPI